MGRILVAVLATLTVVAVARAQERAPSAPRSVPGAVQLEGRRVEAIRVSGNEQVSTAVILNVVRTREGEPLDPLTVEEDYQRIFGLRKFSNVEARVEPTETGAIVIFQVSEQRTIASVSFRGNLVIPTKDLERLVEVRAGEAIDRFRLALAKQSIEGLYRSRNHPFAEVTVNEDLLTRSGEVVFDIVEGPNVRIRNIRFEGNTSFSEDTLKGQLQSKTWIWILRPGTFDQEVVEDDVAAIRKFYENKGYFDVRVGRKILFSPNQTEVQIDFLIEEGVRYSIDRVVFQGISSVTEADLRREMKLLEGLPYDNDILQRDIRAIVRVYSPLGFIYQPQSQDPAFLRIDTRPVFKRDAGLIDLVYTISEGTPFRVGEIRVKGNSRTQDKVVLREMRIEPGELFNSGEVQDAADRLRATPFFESLSITPIGDDPEYRDVLVEVKERRTASFTFGAGVNSNGGLGGNLTYEQRNFDITNFPKSWSDVFSDRAFVGAGQTFRVSIEPGTQQSNASIRFTEPWLFDQPYSMTLEAYLRDRRREHYDDQRIGGRASFGRRFNYTYSGLLTFRAEQVEIDNIRDEPIRADEILEEEGENILTSIGIQGRRDTTNRGLLPSRGTTTTLAWESFGAMGGDYTFQRLTASFDWYITVGEDLMDRKTILVLHADTGYIIGDAPFFERFYGGGIGSVRGFSFRGISPRSGPDEDRVGGDFFATATAELIFPLVGDQLRGVVFADVGTVEDDFKIGTIRTSVGAGIRMILPFFGQAPLAIDFGFPITKDDQDDTQLISFSFGFQS